jgi:hypothetical protein
MKLQFMAIYIKHNDMNAKQQPTRIQAESQKEEKKLLKASKLTNGYTIQIPTAQHANKHALANS